LGIDQPVAPIIHVFSHQNIVTIENKSLVPVKHVVIMDITGRIVWQGKTTDEKTEIMLNVSSGIYAVSIITGDNRQLTTKINIIP